MFLFRSAFCDKDGLSSVALARSRLAKLTGRDGPNHTFWCALLISTILTNWYISTMLDKQAVLAAISTVPSWYHQIEVSPGIVTPGINNAKTVLSLMDLPKDLAGKRVLDIGARDGFFSFECERRGAEVIAIDYVSGDRTGFNVARDLLGSQLKLHHDNAYNVTPEKYGTFDIVLLLGLLYHLRDPLFVLDAIRGVCRAALYVETAIWPVDSPEPVMRFHPLRDLNDDPSNYWSPNPACLRAMIEEANFVVNRYSQVNEARGLVVASVRGDSTLEYQAEISRNLVV